MTTDSYPPASFLWQKANAPKTFTSVVTALRDTGYAVNQLFVQALIAFLILLALWIVRSHVMPLTAGLIAVAAKLSCGALLAFLITPYAIAVHRFIILGERTMSYRIAPAEPKFRGFFGWSLALLVLMTPDCQERVARLRAAGCQHSSKRFCAVTSPSGPSSHTV
jgi:hypothetical protein